MGKAKPDAKALSKLTEEAAKQLDQIETVLAYANYVVQRARKSGFKIELRTEGDDFKEVITNTIELDLTFYDEEEDAAEDTEETD